MVSELLQRLNNGDERALKDMFCAYYAQLVLYANAFLVNREAAEDLVQEFFITFWYEKKYCNITSDLEGYLYKAVRNHCLNDLRAEKRRNSRLIEMVVEEVEEFQFRMDELEEKAEIQKALDKLPEQCRLIFDLCCLEEMKYQEVADRLGISINTVRTQMGRAFKSLRDSLSGKTFTMLLVTIVRKS